MNFTYKAVTFEVGILIEQNIIVASHIDKQKIKKHHDSKLGPLVQMNYGDILSVSIPISNIQLDEEDKGNVYGSLCNKHWDTVVKKLCDKLDEKGKLQ